jgi:hypothetical protein
LAQAWVAQGILLHVTLCNGFLEYGQSDGPSISTHILDRASDISGTRSPHHSARFHLPVNLSRSKSLYVSNNIRQMIYNPQFLIKIWINTVCWSVFGNYFCERILFYAVIVPTCQSFPMKLDPDFRCNLTSNQSKCVWVTMVIMRDM